MEEYQKRVVDEKEILDRRIETLSDFLGSSEVATLKPVDLQLMLVQLGQMLAYSGTLGQRIAGFGQ